MQLQTIWGLGQGKQTEENEPKKAQETLKDAEIHLLIPTIKNVKP